MKNNYKCKYLTKHGSCWLNHVGHNVFWITSDNLLTVSHTSLCLGGGDPPFKIYNGSLEFTDERINNISRRCFTHFTHQKEILRTITIPSYVKNVDNCAFAFNSKLETIRYMSSAPISKRCFYNCYRLKNIYIYGDVKYISDDAFKCIDRFGDFDEVDLPITIYSKKNSYVEKWAKHNCYKFKLFEFTKINSDFIEKKED